MALETVSDLQRRYWMQELGGDPELERYSNADLELMFLEQEVEE